MVISTIFFAPNNDGFNDTWGIKTQKKLQLAFSIASEKWCSNSKLATHGKTLSIRNRFLRTIVGLWSIMTAIKRLKGIFR